MKKSLKGKLIIAFLGVALITVLVVSAVIWLTSGQSLMNLVVEEQTAYLKEAVQTYYTAAGDLDGFFNDFTHNQKTPPGSPQFESPPKPGYFGAIRGVLGMVDAQSRAVIPTFEFAVGETVPADRIRQTVPVEVDGQTIAWILPDLKFQFTLNAQEQVFLQRTTLAIGLAALAGMLAAVLLGFLLASRIVKPIQRLTQASQALTQGSLLQQVPVTSQDELGQLTLTFNQMSADLNQADQQRKRLTADITHDLSTPLQVISGYIEMLEEGEVTLTPQRIDTMKTEIEHLRRLVGDLSTLTQVEAGGLEIQLAPVQPGELIERIYQIYQPIAARQGVKLICEVPGGIPEVLVDEGRFLQVLKNLVENALRYTPAGEVIRLSARGGEQVEIQVSDSGSGIEADDLPYVFERFYQADKARVTNSGKMGLGLAICKALVTAQNGTISAESPGRGQGTTITIRLKGLSDEEVRGLAR